MTYDIIIFASKNKFDNIKCLYDSLVHLQPTYNKVYCICPELPSILVEGIDYVLDKDVLEVPKPKIRANWVYQQYMKFFQTITIDNYLVIDADIIFNKDIQIINNDVPNFLISNSTINRPFFRWMKEMFEMDRTFDKSFISEIMLFNRNIVNELIPNKDDFISKSNSIITPSCFPSEYETYGNYIYTNYRDTYDYKMIKLSPQFLYTRFEGTLEEFIVSQKDSIFDILSL